MRIIEEKELRQILTMDKAIELMRETFKRLGEGRAIQPLRTIQMFPGNNAFGFMPAHIGDYFGAKILTAFPSNEGTEYPSHMGYVILFENEHGCPVGLVDATSVTEIRTGAVSAVATDLLANPDAETLAIIGAGAQGRSHLKAMLKVRPGIRKVRVFDIRKEASERYVREMSSKTGLQIEEAFSVRDAVRDADIICTVTPSKEAYLTRDMVKEGAHINAVGTFSPVTREVASDLFRDAIVIADDINAMKKESGEYLIPLEEGIIKEDHVKGDLGDLITGKIKGRTSASDITIFDALGLAAEDVMCARYALVSD